MSKLKKLSNGELKKLNGGFYYIGKWVDGKIVMIQMSSYPKSDGYHHE